MPILFSDALTPVDSSDGVLHLLRDDLWASVGITVDWLSLSPQPWRTTVVATREDGTTYTVRSGDLMYTPGGDGYAYDHEAQLEATTAYRAYGYDGAGALVQTSTTGSIATAPIQPSKVWVKSLGNPSLSFLSYYQGVTTSRAKPLTKFNIPGRSNPVVWADVTKGREGTLTLLAVSAPQVATIRALLAAGGPVLIQFADAVNVADIYASLGDATEEPVGPRSGAVATWALAYTETDRPGTTGSPLRVPGWTNDIVAASSVTYPTYTAFDAAFASYVAQAVGP